MIKKIKWINQIKETMKELNREIYLGTIDQDYLETCIVNIRYLTMKIFETIRRETRLNIEEFLGLPEI